MIVGKHHQRCEGNMVHDVGHCTQIGSPFHCPKPGGEHLPVLLPGQDCHWVVALRKDVDSRKGS
jgi:hypothetical protein